FLSIDINGQEDCDCTGESCNIQGPFLYNGLSASFSANDDSIRLRPNDFIIPDAQLPATSYSFSTNPTDTIATFGCGDDGFLQILVYAHQAGVEPRPTSTYLILPPAEECTADELTGAPAVVIHGLAVPNTSAEIVSVPARAFAPKPGPTQQLAFSTNPNDTIFTLRCDQIGMGGIPLSLFNHAAGSPGPPAVSFLIGDDAQDHCGATPTGTAPNDLFEDALLLPDSTLIYQEFTNATLDLVINRIDEEIRSVWYRAPKLIDGLVGDMEINVAALDSIHFSLYTYTDEVLLLWQIEDNINGDTTFFTCFEDQLFEEVFFRVVIQNADSTARFFMQVRADVCSSTNEQLNQEKISIYPNPSTGYFHISSSNQTIINSLQVFNSNGQLVLQKSHSTNWGVDLSAYPAGIYWLKLTNRDRSWMEKIIVY
ncbi:MAG: T9SS type A sorting domain-containing protein, partial [Bacteroidota bacterium]